MSNAAEAQHWKLVRERWLTQIAQDAELPFHVYKIAYFLAALTNDKTHQCWPRTDKSAKKIGYRSSLVRRAIDLLAQHGHMIQVDSPGEGLRPLFWRLIVKAQPEKAQPS
jgi:hypothetical protein